MLRTLRTDCTWNISLKFVVALAIVCLLSSFCSSASAKLSLAPKPAALWITGYYPGWQNTLTPADIDYSSLTDVIYFTLFPTADGGLDPAGNGVNDATANDLASKAHAAGVKVLICVGGEGAGNAYRQAIKAPVRDAFVKNIVDWIKAHNFDGADIDFEPMKEADGPDFEAFADELREALNRLEPGMLMTAAVECGGFPKIFEAVQDDFDQLNLMTYDMAGGWSAETWYNSPLTNGKSVKALDGSVLPATDQFVTKWTADVPAEKLGIGVCCEGRVWHGATGLAQARGDSRVRTLSYSSIMDQYYKPDRYRWDDDAKASSLVVPGSTPADNALVVYDDVRDIEAKVAFAEKNGLGGIILWELSEQYRPSMPVGQRHPLLSAVHDAVIGQ